MAGRLVRMALILVLCLGLLSPLAAAGEPVAAEKPPSTDRAKDARADAEARQSKAETDADLEYYELYKVLADTMFQVEQNYVQEVSRRELIEAAIDGVIKKLDPYSNYISPDELGRFKTDVESQFGGIGIQVSMENGELTVISPLVGSPAYHAGMQAGDRIVEIEGESIEGIALSEAVRRLKGEAGTTTTITVIHPGSTEKEKITLTREIVQIETVMGDARKHEDDSWNFMLDDEHKIGYIRITAFSRETARDLEDAISELKDKKLRGLILDLRFNPGGLLTAAIDIADLFVSEGLIVSTKGRNTRERQVKARKDGTYTGFPIAVLVNRYSASASEIVAACLQDHERAVVIGERTWGKGSVQNVIELEDGRSALKLTTASYWRPSGKNIHRFPDAEESDEWGVMPNPGFEVKLTDAELGQLVRDRRDRDVLLVNHSPAGRKTIPKSDGDNNETKPDDDGNAKPKGDDAEAKPKGDGGEAKPDGDKDQAKPEKKDPPAEEPTKTDKATDKAVVKPFVDRQLAKAVEYLTERLAKAD